MNFQDELHRTDSNPFICCEIETETSVLRYSNRPVEEPGVAWEPLIQNQTLTISREMDPETQQISLSAVSLVLNNRVEDNGVGFFANLLDSGVELENKPAHIYLKFERDGQWSSEKVYSGVCSPGELTDTTFPITIKPNLETRLGILQRQVNDIDFPNAPDDSIGKGLNLILGESANGTTGTVQLTLVEENSASGTAKLVVAQHRITSVDKLFRRRSSQYVELTAGYTVNTNDSDDKGRTTSTISISTGHNKGDEYLADVKGLPGKGYVSLDGSALLSRSADDLEQLDFGSDEFTIEISMVPDRLNQLESLISHNGSGGDRGWMLYKDSADKIRFYLSGDGTNVNSAVGDTAITSTTETLIIRASITPGAGIDLNLNGHTESLTWSGSMPDSIFFPTADFNIGAWNSALAHFQGKIHYAVFARGAQPGNNYREDPLEDIISEWVFTHDGGDIQGRNDLDNSGTPVFTCTEHEKNPALTFRQVLLSHEGIHSEDIDEASVVQAAQVCNDLGLDVSGVHGGVIPKTSGQVDSTEDRSQVLQELARNFGHNLVPLASGKVGLKQIQNGESSSESMVHYSHANRDFKNAFLTIKFNPLKRANEVRALLKHSHASSGNHEGYLRGYNQISQDIYGKAEQQWNYSFQRDVQAIESVLGPRISLRSGRTRQVSFTVPGFKGLQSGSDVGDIIKITAPEVYGNFAARQIMVTSTSVDLINGGVNIKGLTLGDAVGAIAFSSEETIVIPATESTFIGATETLCSGNSFPYADANASYGNNDFLMHGHHFGDEVGSICVEKGYGYSNINWKTLIKWHFNPNQLTDKINSLTLVLNIKEIPSLLYKWELGSCLYRSRWVGVGVTVSDYVDWNSSSSYNSIFSNIPTNETEVGFVNGSIGINYTTLQNEAVVNIAGKVLSALNSGVNVIFTILMENQPGGDYTNTVKMSSVNDSINNVPRMIITYRT